MKLADAIEWAHRAEPAEVFIAGHPRRTQNALWALVEEVERLTALCADFIATEGGVPTREENISLTEKVARLVVEKTKLTALCDGYRGDIGRLLQEVSPAREIVQRGFKGAVGTIREAIEIEAYAAALNKDEVNRLQSALTRARAEGMEAAAVIAETISTPSFGSDAKWDGYEMATEDIASAIRLAKDKI